MNKIIDRLIERAERLQKDPWFKERLEVLEKLKNQEEEITKIRK